MKSLILKVVALTLFVAGFGLAQAQAQTQTTSYDHGERNDGIAVPCNAQYHDYKVDKFIDVYDLSTGTHSGGLDYSRDFRDGGCGPLGGNCDYREGDEYLKSFVVYDVNGNVIATEADASPGVLPDGSAGFVWNNRPGAAVGRVDVVWGGHERDFINDGTGGCYGTGFDYGGTTSCGVGCFTQTPLPCPSVGSFSADSTTIFLGQSVTLSWSTSASTSVTLNGSPVPSSGSTVVTPSSTTTYTLVASNGGAGGCGDDVRQITVTVIPPPTIDGFSADANPICAGASTTLSWSSSGASSASITDLATGSVTPVAASGSMAVAPPTSRTYRLTVSNGAGSVTQDIAITVNPLASINGFSADTTSIFAGQNVTLSWNVSNTSSRSITDLATGAVTGLGTESGSTVFTPPSSRTYRLTASNGCNSVTQDIAVSVTPAPTINSLSASANPICAGASTTLSWSSSGASSGSITDLSTGAVTPVGVPDSSLAVTPPDSRTYRLTVSNGAGSVTQDIAITVNPLAVINGFSTSAGSIGAGQGVTLSWNVSNTSSLSITDLATGAVTPLGTESGSQGFAPASTRTYRLTASNGCNSVTQDVTITVVPTINSFSASAGSVCAGSSTNLSWTTTGATSASITDLTSGSVTPVAVSGSLAVTPASTRTYRLTASNGSGSVTQDVSVTVNPLASITSYTASASTINAGQSVTLSWNTANTSSLSITDLTSGTVTPLATASGSQAFTPASTRTYRLTATNGCNSVTQDISVTVTQPPSIGTFTASVNPVCAGSSTTLSWTTTGATSGSVTDLTSGTVTSVTMPNGSLAVSPASSRTFRLTATNSAGSVTQDLAVTVNPLASITSYSASATSINAGQSVTLTWNTANTSSRSITDLTSGTVTPLATASGSQAFTPATSRTYRLTATNGCNSVTQDIAITVTQPPSISSLTASTNPVCAGSSTTLSWSSSGGTSASITDLTSGTVTSVAVSGTLAVSPPTSRSYRLTVTNGAGSVTQDIAITVNPLASITSYTASATTITVGQSVTLSWNTANTSSRSITDLSTGTVTPLATASGSQAFSPATSRTYRLTATNGCNSVTQDIAITVNNCQTLVSFTASATTIYPGQSVTLSWNTTNATSASINGTPVAVPSGTLVVSPNTTTTYTITVGGACAAVTQSVTVNVTPCPTAAGSTFTASPSTIVEGQSATLSWNVPNATAVSIDNGIGSVAAPSGTRSVSPAATTTYTLTANGGGSCSAFTMQTTVTVTPCQTIGSFSASAASIVQGQSTNLTWATTGATATTITDLSTGTVTTVTPASGGSISVSPSSTRTYRLTVTGPCATLTRDVTVTVTPCQTVASLTASSTSIVQGQSTTLSYTLTGATSATITDLSTGTVTPVAVQSGTLAVSPSSTRTYRLTAVGPCANVTQDITINVTQCPAVAGSTFSASPSTISQFQSATLSWNVPNATTISIDNGVGTVAAPSGTASVSPAGTTTYTLTASGAAGCSAITMQTTVTVSLVTGDVLIGPAGQPAATGPTGTNDDFTHKTMRVAFLSASSGTTTGTEQVVFVNTVRNNAPVADTITVRLQGVSGAAFSNAYEISTNGGASYVPLIASGVTISVPAQSNFDVRVRVTVPAGRPVLTGFPATIRAISGITPSAFNETIDSIWSGFVRADKSAVVTNSTGVGGANDPVSGADIEYVISYQNVTPALAGSGNVPLTATNFVISEDGNVAPNNWGASTDQVVGSASDSRGGSVAGDAAGSAALTDTVPSLAPGQSGTFRFKRRIR